MLLLLLLLFWFISIMVAWQNIHSLIIISRMCIVLSAGEYREAQTDSKHGRIATNATFVPPDQIKRYIIIICTIILFKHVCLSVDVSKLQVAILARLSREMSQTVRIDCNDCRSFLSRVRISAQASNYLYAKNTQKLSRKPSLMQLTVE